MLVRLADTLLCALGVEGQGDMAEILDVEGGGLGRDGLPLGPLLLLELRLLVDLLGGRLEDGAVFVQLVLEPLDELVLLVELQLQLVDERVALAQLLDLLLESVLEVAQGAHRSGWLERLFIPTSLLVEKKSYAKKKKGARLSPYSSTALAPRCSQTLSRMDSPAMMPPLSSSLPASLPPE